MKLLATSAAPKHNADDESRSARCGRLGAASARFCADCGRPGGGLCLSPDAPGLTPGALCV